MAKRKAFEMHRSFQNGTIRMEPFSIDFERDGHYCVTLTLFEPSAHGSFMCWSEKMAREVVALLSEKFTPNPPR